jgi:hypothetical protein
MEGGGGGGPRVRLWREITLHRQITSKLLKILCGFNPRQSDGFKGYDADSSVPAASEIARVNYQNASGIAEIAVNFAPTITTVKKKKIAMALLIQL